MTANDQKTFIVLGMHRSATSLVAKGLCMAGVHMGSKMLAPSEHNTFGHWEDTAMIAINHQLLKKAGGSWDVPPDEKDILAVAKSSGMVLREFFAKKNKKYLYWGWKDPRTTLTIKCFLPYLVNPHFICCYRDPFEIAKSLQIRNGFSLAKGIELATIYNTRMMDFMTWWTEQQTTEALDTIQGVRSCISRY